LLFLEQGVQNILCFLEVNKWKQFLWLELSYFGQQQMNNQAGKVLA
jgi:hypothetical protein